MRPDRATLSLDRVMERVGRYVQDYGVQLSVVIGVETYTQVMGDVGRMTVPQALTLSKERAAAGWRSTGIISRTLVAEVALVQLPDDWMGFRDVYEVDGQRTGDRTDRLQKRFLETPEGRDMPVKGTLWVDPSDGRVFKTEMEIQAEPTIVRVLVPDSFGSMPAVEKRELRSNTATLSVTYRLDPRLQLLVPAEMTEFYEGPWIGPDPGMAHTHSITCRATYADFKRFETSGRLVIPK